MLFFNVIGKNRKTRSKLNTSTTKSTEIKVSRQFCFGLDRTKYSSSRNFLSACLIQSLQDYIHSAFHIFIIRDEQIKIKPYLESEL